MGLIGNGRVPQVRLSVRGPKTMGPSPTIAFSKSVEELVPRDVFYNRSDP
jgi:hypothetical protein